MLQLSRQHGSPGGVNNASDYAEESSEKPNDPEVHKQLLGITTPSIDSQMDLTPSSKRRSLASPLALPGVRPQTKQLRRRLIYKNGECNVAHANIRKRRQRFLADIFTTLVDIKWRWNLFIFVLAFTSTWVIFAVIWWFICYAHGDLDHFGQADWKPCVEEVKDFTTALLFSIETQHTIGYGSRQTTSTCPQAVLAMMTQSCFGVIIQALMTGLVFAKLSRPKKRAETLMFSKTACICKRDGVFCLIFRVGDMRRSHIVEAHVRALLIKKKVTTEGEVMPLYQHEVDIGDEEGESRLFLVWPVILEHKITETSPFWKMNARDFHKQHFELLVILEGIVESTGMTAQARTSYLPGEILWGQRFERLVTFDKERAEYQIDYSRFHSTVAQEIPSCSAYELHRRGKDAGYNPPSFEHFAPSSPSGSSDEDERDSRNKTATYNRQNGQVVVDKTYFQTKKTPNIMKQLSIEINSANSK